MSENYVVALDDHWSVELTGLDLEVMKLKACRIFRPDGKYFQVVTNTAIGYLQPWMKETADKGGKIGTVGVKVRQDPRGVWYVVVENDVQLTADERTMHVVRAERGSVDNPDMPKAQPGEKQIQILVFSPGDLNNKRIYGGPVRNFVIIEEWDKPLLDKEKLLTFLKK